MDEFSEEVPEGSQQKGHKDQPGNEKGGKKSSGPSGGGKNAGDDGYNCNRCQGWFSNLEALIEHVKEKHSKRKMAATNEDFDPSKRQFIQMGVAFGSHGEEDAGHRHWANNCQYECAICSQFITSSSVKFSLHILKRHNLSGLTEYKARYGPARTVLAYHHCLICKAKIVHDYYVMTTHLKYQHGKTLAEYYPMFLLSKLAYENEAMEKVSAKKLSNSDSKLDGMCKAEHVNVKLETPEEEKSEEELQQDEHISSKWANMCRYDCVYCSYTTSAHQHFRAHVLKKHSMRMDEYNQGQPVRRAVVVHHLCKIANCGKKLLHDREYLTGHLWSQHRMTLPAYHRKFVVSEETSKVATDGKEIVDADEFHFICQICQKKFPNSGGLLLHLEQTHGVGKTKLTPKLVTKECERSKIEASATAACTVVSSGDSSFEDNEGMVTVKARNWSTLKSIEENLRRSMSQLNELKSAEERKQIKTEDPFRPEGLPINRYKDVRAYFRLESNCLILREYLRQNGREAFKSGELLPFIWSTCFTNDLTTELKWKSITRDREQYRYPYMPREFIDFLDDLISYLREVEGDDWGDFSQCDDNRVVVHIRKVTGEVER